MQVLLVLLLVSFSVHLNEGQPQPSPDLLSMVMKLQNQVLTLQNNVLTLENKVQTLENNQTQGQKSPVAFFAGCRQPSYYGQGHVGLFPTDTIIKYEDVYTNIGNGYNPSTGVFTAPVKGLYVFHFSAFKTQIIAPTTLAVPKKNTEPLPSTLMASVIAGQDSSTRVAVVTLEVGETIYVELPARKAFFDGFGQQNSFSGFLLAPL